MFRHLGDDVVALTAVFLRHALDREIVRFGSAACEDDLPRAGVDEAGDLSTRVFDSVFGFPAEFVAAAGGIAEFFREIRQHCIQDARIDGRGRLVIEVYRQLERHLLHFSPLSSNASSEARLRDRRQDLQARLTRSRLEIEA